MTAIQNRPEWLDVKTATQYACVSERTLRTWVVDPVDPLPASRVGGKILIRRSNLDEWLEKHRIEPSDLDAVVSELLAAVKE